MAALKDLALSAVGIAEVRKPFSSKISQAQRRDKRDAIEAVAQEMDAAAMKHDAEGVWLCVSRLWRGMKHLRKRSVQPSRSARLGRLFEFDDELPQNGVSPHANGLARALWTRTSLAAYRHTVCAMLTSNCWPVCAQGGTIRRLQHACCRHQGHQNSHK